MIKKSIFLALSALLIASSAFAAPTRAGRTDWGLNGSWANPTDDDTDDSIYVGANISEGVNDWFGVGASFGWTQLSDGLDGDLNGFPLLAEAIFRVPTGDAMYQPYGVVGAGVIFWNYDEASVLEAANIEGDVDDAFAVKLGGGVDFFVDEHWILNLEASYIFSDTDVEFTNKSTGAVATFGNLDSDMWFLGGGVKYLF